MRLAPPDPNARARHPAPGAPLLLLALAGAVAAVWFLHSLGYWQDRGYLHLELARSIAAGQGFRFNGQVVYADSAPLWIWLLAGLHLLIPRWLAAGKVLTIVGSGIALSGVFAFARRLGAGRGKTPSLTFAALVTLLLAANPCFGLWAFSGTDTLIAAGLAGWGLATVTGRLTEPIAPRRLLLGCVCAGLGPLLGPEMILYTLLLGLLVFVRWVNTPLRFRRKLGLFFLGVLLVLGPGAAWLVFTVRTFGTGLPTTYVAGQARPEMSVAGLLLRLLLLGFPLVPVGSAALPVWLALRWQGKSSISADAVAGALDASGWLPLFWTAAVCTFALGFHMRVQTSWLLAPAFTATVSLLALALRLWPRIYGAGAVLAFGVALLVSTCVAWPTIGSFTALNRERAALALAVQDLPPGAPVALYTPAEVAFLSRRPVVDLSGLTRPGAARFRWDATDNRRLWWAHEQGTRYLVLDHFPEPGSQPVWTRDVPPSGWSLDPGDEHAFDHLILWRLPKSPTITLPADMPTDDQP